MKLVLLLLIAVTTGEKTCPSIIPIFQGAATSLTCNTTINPTGNTVDDPPCQYPQCTSDRSAVCGCVDYSQYGGTGMFWGCMHSRCKCPTPDSNIKENDSCDIHGSDFQNPSFVGDAPVSGDGCTMGNGDGRVGCLCKPVLGNDIPVEDWTWQCNANVIESNNNNNNDITGYVIGIIVVSVIAMVAIILSIIVISSRKRSNSSMDVSGEMIV